VNIEQTLKDALRELGEIEFLPGLLIVPGAEVFERHADIFSKYAESLEKGLDERSMARFLYLDRSDFNACAFQRSGHQFISINWGVVILLYDLFLRILSSPAALVRIGNPSEEVFLAKHKNLLLNARELPTSENDPFGLAVAPINEARGAYALYLVQIALDFLFMHEHQHVAGGHMFFMEDSPISRISEIENHAWIEDLLTRHVLELEADAAAANFSLGIAMDLKGNAWRIPPGAEDCLATEESRIDAWLFAVMVMFLVMEEAVNRRKARVTHPSPMLRIWLVLSVLWVRNMRFTKPSQLLGFAIKIMREADIAISSVAQRPSTKRFVLEHVSSTVDEHKILLKRRWLEMNPRLEYLAEKYGALCAPLPLVEFFAEA